MAQSQFYKGYQEAMADVFNAYQRAGVAGMLQWIADNAVADLELAKSARSASVSAWEDVSR